jgi:hypothetical protein
MATKSREKSKAIANPKGAHGRAEHPSGQQNVFCEFSWTFSLWSRSDPAAENVRTTAGSP